MSELPCGWVICGSESPQQQQQQPRDREASTPLSPEPAATLWGPGGRWRWARRAPGPPPPGRCGLHRAGSDLSSRSSAPRGAFCSSLLSRDGRGWLCFSSVQEDQQAWRLLKGGLTRAPARGSVGKDAQYRIYRKRPSRGGSAVGGGGGREQGGRGWGVAGTLGAGSAALAATGGPFPGRTLDPDRKSSPSGGTGLGLRRSCSEGRASGGSRPHVSAAPAVGEAPPALGAAPHPWYQGAGDPGHCRGWDLCAQGPQRLLSVGVGVGCRVSGVVCAARGLLCLFSVRG